MTVTTKNISKHS